MSRHTYIFTAGVSAKDRAEAWEIFLEKLYDIVEERGWGEALIWAKDEFEVEQLEDR